jgi:hypothetical protein
MQADEREREKHIQQRANSQYCVRSPGGATGCQLRSIARSELSDLSTFDTQQAPPATAAVWWLGCERARERGANTYHIKRSLCVYGTEIKRLLHGALLHKRKRPCVKSGRADRIYSRRISQTATRTRFIGAFPTKSAQIHSLASACSP